MSVPEIVRRLNAEGFRYVQTELSHPIYGRWANRGHSAGEIERAVAALVAECPK